jgi:DNA mismatch repair protein MutS
MLQPISLMWPSNTPVGDPAGGNWEVDLGLEELIQALTLDKIYQPFIRRVLTTLNTDTSTITWRQSVLTDFIQNEGLVEQIHKLLPQLRQLRQGNSLLGRRQRNLLLETADRLSELEVYVNIVQDLYHALASANLESQALTILRTYLSTLLEDDSFQDLQRDLPDMRAPLRDIRSLTVGINLDVELNPLSAVLLAINDQPFTDRASLLERLIGIPDDQSNHESGIAPLHRTPRSLEQRILFPLFQDLDHILTQVAQPVARTLNRYIHTDTTALLNLDNELAFYIGAVNLMNRAKAKGVLFCQPDVAPIQDRVTAITGLVNISLALRQPDCPVPSRVDLSAEGRIAVLTGPNNGGKTTYLRGVGLAQVMFQAGLHIPGREAAMSPVDMILTHFPALETRQQGRLAEESARLHTIFQKVSPYSFVLLNETFSSTSSGEALYLARDILCGLRAIGVRAVFATHLTELANLLPEIESAVEGDSSIVSLVAGVHLTPDGQTLPTFQISPGMPLGRSYAQEIARHHGISLEQILAMRSTNEKH